MHCFYFTKLIVVSVCNYYKVVDLNLMNLVSFFQNSPVEL